MTTTTKQAQEAVEPDAGEVSIASASPLDNTRLQPRAANGRFMRVVQAAAAADDSGLPADRFLDREISWLQFNERVLQLAADESVPCSNGPGSSRSSPRTSTSSSWCAWRG